MAFIRAGLQCDRDRDIDFVCMFHESIHRQMFGEKEAHTLESAEYMNKFLQHAVGARKKQQEAAAIAPAPKNGANSTEAPTKKKKKKKKSSSKSRKDKDKDLQ